MAALLPLWGTRPDPLELSPAAAALPGGEADERPLDLPLVSLIRIGASSTPFPSLANEACRPPWTDDRAARPRFVRNPNSAVLR